MSYTMVTVDLIKDRGETLKQQREQLVGYITKLDETKAQALANLNVLQGAIQICDELAASANAIDVKDDAPAETPSSPDATGDSTNASA